jgi:hypothetical protein
MSRKIPLTVGFANLSGADFVSFLSEDHAVVSALFERTNIGAERQIPATRILFLYARFAASGALEGSPAVGVRQIAEESGSRILVVASPIPQDTIQNVMSFSGSKTANLVFTLDRKGPAFAGFFRALFERMRDGENMLQAWVELAPQGPMQTDDNPELVLLPEGGGIAFAPQPGQA